MKRGIKDTRKIPEPKKVRWPATQRYQDRQTDAADYAVAVPSERDIVRKDK